MEYYAVSADGVEPLRPQLPRGSQGDGEPRRAEHGAGEGPSLKIADGPWRRTGTVAGRREGVRAACSHHAWSADAAVPGDGTGLRTRPFEWVPLEMVRADAGGPHKRERPAPFRRPF